VTASPKRAEEPQPLELPQPRRTAARRLAGWLERAGALRGSVEALRHRSAAVDATFETVERDSDIGGIMLAGALSYRLFVFALPLAFFLVSGLGLVASTLGREPNVVAGSVGFAGVVTKQVADAADGSSSWWVALSAFVALAYFTRALLRAIAIVHALAWERSARAVKVSGRSFGVFSAALATQLVLVACVGAVNHRTVVGGIAMFVVFVCALAGLWLVVSLQVLHGDARWPDLLPGSALYAVGMVGVVLFNAVLVGRLVEEKSSTYGALGIAAALLLGFFLFGRVIVACAVLNATLYERRSRPRVPPAENGLEPSTPSLSGASLAGHHQRTYVP
jgi:uncharacterized BrkB/YihY/UPF0761 family membrane protein